MGKAPPLTGGGTPFNKAKMTDNRNSLVTLLIFAALFGAGGWMIYQSQQANQVVRPLPDAAPAPVIPQLPDLAAELRKAKSLCEGLARQAKGMAAAGRLAPERLERGRRLYTDAKADFDDCIEYLCDGLSRRFNQADPQRVAERMAVANAKMNAFVQWADQHIPPEGNAGASLPDLAKELLLAWLNGVREANDRAVAQLQEALRACRMQDWGDLGS
jgi:hypothetical protein